MKDIADHLAGKKGIYSMILTQAGLSANRYSGHADIIINGWVLGGTNLPFDLSEINHIDIYSLY